MGKVKGRSLTLAQVPAKLDQSRKAAGRALTPGPSPGSPLPIPGRGETSWGPVSSTVTSTVRPIRRPRNRIVPPGGVWMSALPSRLRRICASRRASACTSGRSGGAAGRSHAGDLAAVLEQQAGAQCGVEAQQVVDGRVAAARWRNNLFGTSFKGSPPGRRNRPARSASLRAGGRSPAPPRPCPDSRGAISRWCPRPPACRRARAARWRDG